MARNSLNFAIFAEHLRNNGDLQELFAADI